MIDILQRTSTYRDVVDDEIINELTNPCAKKIFTDLQNGLYIENPLKPEVLIPAPWSLPFSNRMLLELGTLRISPTLRIANKPNRSDNIIKLSVYLSFQRRRNLYLLRTFIEIPPSSEWNNHRDYSLT